jgi:hypothetical protein
MLDDAQLIIPIRRWRVLRRMSVLLAAYVLAYGVLSATGGWVVSESGEHRIVMAVADQFEWQPRYGSCQRFRSASGDYTLRADTLGYVFVPLILLDQRFIHRTILFFGADGPLDPVPAPPLAQYHPTRSNRFHGRFPYQ